MPMEKRQAIFVVTVRTERGEVRVRQPAASKSEAVSLVLRAAPTMAQVTHVRQIG